MRKMLLILLSVTLNITVFATNPLTKGADEITCAFSGKVLDNANLEALTGAIVEIKDLKKLTYASFDGSFAFKNLPPGTYTIVVKYIGYADQTFEKVKISPESGDCNFRLTSF